MQTKLSRLKELWEAGDQLGALRVAKGFGDLGDQKARIQKGWAAHMHPRTYTEMGQDPAALLADAYLALKERYSL